MASTKKVVEIIMTIRTLYPYFAKDIDSEILVKTWKAYLTQYNDDEVSAAFAKCVETCTMPPTIADMVKHIKGVRQLAEPTAEEMWDIYYKTLRDVLRLSNMFSYTIVLENGITQGDQARLEVAKIWNSLPQKIKQYLASKEEMIRRAIDLNTTEVGYEQARFLKTMPIIEKRMEYNTLIAPNDERYILGEKENEREDDM